MSVVDFLQKLLDAGVELQAAMTAARLHEETVSTLKPSRSKGAVRQARYEERRRQKASETSESVSPDATPSPSPSPQTPQPRPHPRGDITTRAREGRAVEVERQFAAFWAAYPKRKAKDAAAKAFTKALRRIEAEDPLAVILAGIERALPGWDDPQFIPYPASWLNAGSWDDEAPPPRQARTEIARHDRPDTRQADRYENYDASWRGANGASEVLAARRNF